MKRLLTLLFSLVVLGSFAQYPVITATIRGYVTMAGTNLAVEGHMVKVILYSNDSTGTSEMVEVYTNDNGYYTYTGTIQGTEGVLEVQTEVCENQIQIESFALSLNAPYIFTQNFYICEPGGCHADFYYFLLEGMTYQFVNLSSQTEGTEYFWSFGDGTYSYEPYPVKTYDASGEYEVTLTVSSSDSSCSATTTQIVIVDDGEYCKAFFTYSANPAMENTISFADSSMGNPTNFYWEFGDGSTSTDEYPVHTYAQPGFYFVCLTVTNDSTNCYSNYCDNVMVGNIECMSQFTYWPSDSMNVPYAIQFWDYSFGTHNQWTWTFGDGTSSDEQNPVHVYDTTGMYQVCLTISGPDCESTWCMDVWVDEQWPMCYNYFTYMNAGTSVAFEGYCSSSLPTTYLWDFGDGTYVEGNPVTHGYASPGIYWVTLESRDESGCMAYTSQEIVVGDTILFNQVYGQVFEGNFPLTSGFVMIFSEENDSTYYPYFDIIPVDPSGVFVFPMMPNGNFKVMAIPTDGSIYLPTYYESTIFWQDATNVTAGVTPNPVNIVLQSMQGNTSAGPCVISGQINLGGVRDGFVGQIVVYLTDSDHNIIGFAQVNENGTFSFNNLAYGTYYIRPELSGVYSEYQMVTLTAQESVVSVVMTFTGNSILGKKDGIAMTADVLIYPNPANSESRIVFKQEMSGSVKVSFMDLSGRLLSEQVVISNAGSGKADLDLRNIEAGIYILRLQFSDGSEVSRKLIRN